jgi:hypothetical protein
MPTMPRGCNDERPQGAIDFSRCAERTGHPLTLGLVARQLDVGQDHHPAIAFARTYTATTPEVMCTFRTYATARTYPFNTPNRLSQHRKPLFKTLRTQNSVQT